jgi:riboflavin kinase
LKFCLKNIVFYFKIIGIPTANYSDEVVDKLPNCFQQGVYMGYAQLDNDPIIYKMVMSIGTNPYYNNHKKTMETHIMHQFNKDLYGSILKTVLVGYIRPMKNFSNISKIHFINNNNNKYLTFMIIHTHLKMN